MKLWIVYLKNGSITRREVNLGGCVGIELDNLRGERIEIAHPDKEDRGFRIQALEGRFAIQPWAANLIRLDTIGNISLKDVAPTLRRLK